jgi:hypothetical protein
MGKDRESDEAAPLKELLGRTRPWHLAAVSGLLTVVLAIWLFVENAKAGEIVMVSLLVIVGGLVAEGLRQMTEVENRIMGGNVVKFCSSEAATVRVLRRLDNEAPEDSHVLAAWGALGFSSDKDDFSAFVRDQLQHVVARGYVVERWVDTAKVDCETVCEHVADAFDAITAVRYRVHLVRDVPFGALVVDGDAAAINFQAHREMPGVLGIWGRNKTLAKRVRTMIEQLGEGVVLPGGDPRHAELESLQGRVRDFYRGAAT